MKKIFTILCAGILTLGLSAQTDAGGWYLDANLSNLNYSSEKLTSIDVDGTSATLSSDEKKADSDLNFGVAAGYFLMDNLLGGLMINMENGTTGSSGATDNTFKFGPMIRYYIADIGVFGQLSYVMGSNTTNSGGTGATDYKTSGSDLGIGIGYAVMLSDNVSLNPMFSYNMKSFNNKDAKMTMKMSGMSLGATLSIHMF
ncbi:porin family protein [Flavobacteriales bacterium]|nr:porin family protein [Flavobacteriales bacterium]